LLFINKKAFSHGFKSDEIGHLAKNRLDDFGHWQG
jgi:hypothetical protein